MTEKEAITINNMCCANFYKFMGIKDEAPCIRNLSLKDMIKARDIVKKLNARKSERPKNVYMVSDDRLLAAMYTALHFPAYRPQEEDIEPCVIIENKAVIIIKMENQEVN